MRRIKLNDKFEKVSDLAAYLTGHPYHFLISIWMLIIWAAAGPWFSYSDTWQLVINTGTTIITWLLVILIQNSQNRNDFATHVKLDAIMSALDGVPDKLAGIQTEPTSKLKEVEVELTQRIKENGNGDTEKHTTAEVKTVEEDE